MYRTILVPLDGSALGERALPAATMVARASGGRLVLVQAVEPVGSIWANSTSVESWTHNDAQMYLDEVAESLERAGLTVATTIPQQPAAEGILSELSHFNADLIVMTTHGRSGLGRWIYGSVAEAVLSHSPVPVLLVRADAHRTLNPVDQLPLRLLVALDGSPFGEASLPYAVEVAHVLNGTLVLLRAVDSPLVTEGLPEKEMAEAQAYLDQVAVGLREHNVDVQPVVRVGQAADMILEASRAPGIGLVVMSTHGRTGLSQLVFGSVAMQVLRRGGHPVLVVRPLAMARLHSMISGAVADLPR